MFIAPRLAGVPSPSGARWRGGVATLAAGRQNASRPSGVEGFPW